MRYDRRNLAHRGLSRYANGCAEEYRRNRFRGLYTTLNPNLRTEGDELRLLLSYTPEAGLEPLECPRYALPKLKVERRSGVLCARLALGPAGIAIYAAERFPRHDSE